MDPLQTAIKLIKKHQVLQASRLKGRCHPCKRTLVAAQAIAPLRSMCPTHQIAQACPFLLLMRHGCNAGQAVLLQPAAQHKCNMLWAPRSSVRSHFHCAASRFVCSRGAGCMRGTASHADKLARSSCQAFTAICFHMPCETKDKQHAGGESAASAPEWGCLCDAHATWQPDSILQEQCEDDNGAGANAFGDADSCISYGREWAAYTCEETLVRCMM